MLDLHSVAKTDKKKTKLQLTSETLFGSACSLAKTSACNLFVSLCCSRICSKTSLTPVFKENTSSVVYDSEGTWGSGGVGLPAFKWLNMICQLVTQISEWGRKGKGRPLEWVCGS